MKTTRTLQLLSLGFCLGALLFLGTPVRAADGGQGGRGHGQIGQRIEQAKERLSEGLQKLQEGIANHPNAPANVKAAAEKLLNDLKAAIAGFDKVKAALQAHDQAALQNLRTQGQTLRETLKADREALRAALEVARPAGKEGGRGGWLPRGEKQAL